MQSREQLSAGSTFAHGRDGTASAPPPHPALQAHNWSPASREGPRFGIPERCAGALCCTSPRHWGAHGAVRITQHTAAVSVMAEENRIEQLMGLFVQLVLPSRFFSYVVPISMARLEVISGDQLHRDSSLHCPTYEQS